MALIIPAIFIFVIIFAAVKRVNVYESFSEGVMDAARFMVRLLPCLAAIFMMCELFESSGLADLLTGLLAPAVSLLGIPEELTKLLLIKPFSGSGSLAYLTAILEEYGADSYIGRCACVCFGSSETVFYISAVYFSSVKNKKLALPTLCALAGIFLSTVLACRLCAVI